MSVASEKTIFALVGLPARGKSFLSAKIVTFFNWSGVPSRIFNAGSRRRADEGALASGRSSFFCSKNSEAVSKRDDIAMNTLAAAVHWLVEENGTIAIFDATNTTRARRRMIQDYLRSVNAPARLVFIESICNDERVLQNNFLQKVRNSPDFEGMDEAVALDDLKSRIKAYEAVYETVSDEENVPYIKLIDLASKVVCYLIWGTIPMRCVQLLISCHVGHRPVYLARAGHCDGVDDLSQGKWFDDSGIALGAGPWAEASQGPFGMSPRQAVDDGRSRQGSMDGNVKMPAAQTCNAHLSKAGRVFAKRLAKYISMQGHGRDVVTMCSTMPRSVETISAIGCPIEDVQQWSALGILDTGIYHGLSVKFIQEHVPEEYEKWESDPIRYRFPGGESILDMNKRLAEVVLEIEHAHFPVAVVSHLPTIQSLIAYFTGQPPEVIPHLVVPRHSVVVLSPSIYGWSLTTVTEDELPEL
ncbi:unnamed protein product [Ectocarpus fasciculatus]